jgi:hypothetical protein
MSEHEHIHWDSMRATGGFERMEFCGDVAILEVDNIADFYTGAMDIIGGFRVFNRCEVVIANGGTCWVDPRPTTICTHRGPHDVYFRNSETGNSLLTDAYRASYWNPQAGARPFDGRMNGSVLAYEGATIEIISWGQAHRGGGGGRGYVGIPHDSWTSEAAFYALDPWDQTVRNPVKVGGQPYYLRNTTHPIYVYFQAEYRGNIVSTMFKIIERTPGNENPEPAMMRRENIVAYLNGFSIPSVNINGKTYVHEKDLLDNKYGFDLRYCPVRNRLSVTFVPILSPNGRALPVDPRTGEVLVGTRFVGTWANDEFGIARVDSITVDPIRGNTWDGPRSSTEGFGPNTNATTGDRDVSRSLIAAGEFDRQMTVRTNVRVEVGTYWERRIVDAYRYDGGMLINIEDLGFAEYVRLRRELRVESQYPFITSRSPSFMR